MREDRLDMSSWVSHFIHDRNPQNDPGSIFSEGEAIEFPYACDSEKNARYAQWYCSDECYPIEPDGTALQVLYKIIDDGHIRSTWSFRNGRPTIYGPRAAVCFTEMPLYALIHYAKHRADRFNVQPYGISLSKRDTFRVGARPVIYGLTGNHRQVPDNPEKPEHVIKGWPRILSPSCGIAENEQYRYVSFNLDQNGYSDWTHEREWRWCDSEDQYSCPGFPLYLNEAPDFSTILVFVPTAEEALRVLDRLKTRYDTGYDHGGDELHRKNLLNTRVIALDEVPKESLPRLEDIPMRCLNAVRHPEPSAELIFKAQQVIQEAQAAAQAAADARYYMATGGKDIPLLDVCGFASLMISEPQSELTAALLRLGAIEPLGRLGYMFTNLEYEVKDQGLCLEEAAMAAAQAIFEKHFPGARVWVYSRWD